MTTLSRDASSLDDACPGGKHGCYKLARREKLETLKPFRKNEVERFAYRPNWRCALNTIVQRSA